MRTFALLFVVHALASLALAQAPSPDDPPRADVLMPGVKLTEVAVNPDVVTPTGIDVDDAGRIEPRYKSVDTKHVLCPDN